MGCKYCPSAYVAFWLVADGGQRAISAFWGKRSQASSLWLDCQTPAAARGGFLVSSTAIAEISGRMKKASSAG
jgi:hypothetical protein